MYFHCIGVNNEAAAALASQAGAGAVTSTMAWSGQPGAAGIPGQPPGIPGQPGALAAHPAAIGL